eukprot:gnl/Spiro4/13494_TR7193_c0_g1_i1.p1 gnl/Spiro4/13494_TR7193_c0_g1~~gnl/Spiro4/13494_TR7193_c0_g1_i1.p1  ORF type:complete len:328 (+),score=65.24 gnl/Spiro4/13494_TR7193_c0_g1_i1:31-984(+)
MEQTQPPSTVASFDTGHDDMIHDAQADYYGKLLATCSSDRLIKIYDISDPARPRLVTDLTGHDGPVWQVAWAHPKFGRVLASCSYDHKVIVWRDSGNNQWSAYYEYKDHTSSVNSIAWAPHEFGLILACASSDCNVSVHTWNDRADGSWEVSKFFAHTIGCNAISWCPYAPSGSLISTPGAGGESAPARRFVTGGCDRAIKIWTYDVQTNQWRPTTLDDMCHNDWVRDVAWAPNIGLPTNVIASCSQDKTLCIWTEKSNSNGGWERKEIHKFPTVVWRLSWSPTGNILAVSSGNNEVSLWKENHDGVWKDLQRLGAQ